MVDCRMAAETMMLTASIWDKPVRQFMVVNSNELEKQLPGNNTDLIGCFKTFPIETINQKYFPFTPPVLIL